MNDIENNINTIEIDPASEVLINSIYEINSDSSAVDLMKIVIYYSRLVILRKGFDVSRDPDFNAWLKEAFTSATLVQASIRNAFLKGEIGLQSTPRYLGPDADETQVEYYQKILLVLKEGIIAFNPNCNNVIQLCEDVNCQLAEQYTDTCIPLTAKAA